MIFNFFLANQPAERLKKLYDLVRPVQHGLVECGHHVIGYGLGLLPAPAVNLMVEFFPDDAFVDGLLELKSGAGAGLVLGILSAEDVEDDEAMEIAVYPRRLPNLRRVLEVADFAWSVLPQVSFYEAACGAGHAAMVNFGFSERLLNRHVIAEPQLRDVDVFIDGDATPRRRDLVDALTRRGLKCYLSGTAPLPSFATADLARRAKIFLDVRRGSASRFSSARRICKGLHNGALVLTERAGEPLALDRFTVGCDPAQIVDQCAATIASGMAVPLGLAALQKFRTETSMREGVQQAVGLPALQRLAG